MRPGKILRLLIWLAVPFFLWWVLGQAPLREIGETLSRLSLVQLSALVALNLFITLLFNSRWWLILVSQGRRLPYLELAGYRLAGFAISYFTPGTQFGGEPLQVHLLEKFHQVTRLQALASVTLDRLLELVGNFTFLAAGVLLILNGSFLQSGGFTGIGKFNEFGWAAALLILPLFYLGILWIGKSPLSSALRRLTRRFPGIALISKAHAWLTAAESEITSLLRRKPATVLASFIISGLLWLLSIAEYWLMLSFLGAHLDLAQAVSALAMARLAFLTPLPGGVGALEASQMLAMQALGFAPALGISASLLIRARDISLGLLGVGWGAFLTRHNPTQPLPGQAGEGSTIP